MPRKRKTVTIEFIKDLVNRRNKQSTCGPQAREAWNSLLSEILMACNVYNGFRYLAYNEVPKGHEPGIETLAHDIKVFPDDTRRFYH